MQVGGLAGGGKGPGIGRRPRCSFWLTLFFQSDILPLFFSGLLSYLVGIKKRISRLVTSKRDNFHFLRYVLISPEAEILGRP